MKQKFDWLREQMLKRIKLYQTLDVTETAVDVAIKETERFIEVINEAEAKWEAELRKHDTEVRNKAIDEFAKKLRGRFAFSDILYNDQVISEVNRLAEQLKEE